MGRLQAGCIGHRQQVLIAHHQHHQLAGIVDGVSGGFFVFRSRPNAIQRVEIQKPLGYHRPRVKNRKRAYDCRPVHSKRNPKGGQVDLLHRF